MASYDPFDPTGYHFTSIPSLIPAPPPEKERTVGVNNRVLMEHLLTAMGVLLAYRRDLSDGVRVYAVDNRYVDRLLKDSTGSYVLFRETKYYFTLGDPTGSRVVTRDWQVLV
jgi:hypothetical protein